MDLGMRGMLRTDEVCPGCVWGWLHTAASPFQAGYGQTEADALGSAGCRPVTRDRVGKCEMEAPQDTGFGTDRWWSLPRARRT